MLKYIFWIETYDLINIVYTLIRSKWISSLLQSHVHNSLYNYRRFDKSRELLSSKVDKYEMFYSVTNGGILCFLILNVYINLLKYIIVKCFFLTLVYIARETE